MTCSIPAEATPTAAGPAPPPRRLKFAPLGRTAIGALMLALTGLPAAAADNEVMVLLSDRVISDPVSAINPKALPGAIVAYEAQVIYNGLLPLTADSLVLTNSVPANMSLVVAAPGSSTSSPFDFVDGALPSNLFCNLQLLSGPGDCIEFSNNGGASFDYVPQPNADGADPAITHFRFHPRGSMAAATLFPSSFTLVYRMKVN